MKKILLFWGLVLLTCNVQAAETIPLPEHPRPDFQRAEWINLNGPWAFTFQAQTAKQALADGDLSDFQEQITVPFPWGSKLSGVPDEGDRGWYGRQITVPEAWKGKRVFLVIGASDWKTEAWLNGQPLGVHQGGYTPFEFELTDKLEYGTPQTLLIEADDTPSDQHLGGKQGYGNARGIWQTVYLEARGNHYIEYVHFSPDIERSSVKVAVALNQPSTRPMSLSVHFRDTLQSDFLYKPTGKAQKSNLWEFEIPLTDQHLWSLEDPYLYETEVVLSENGQPVDRVESYFGQRQISVIDLPGSGHPYVALNGKPIYLQLCLDQSYHPEGFYTFPSDEFMRNEILLSKRLGLTGNRIHIKAEIPRKLYWADKLGVLIMADIPNFWGEPRQEARQDWEYCMRNQIRRDYNHPSIFCWVDFNETWGLFTQNAGPEGNQRLYLPETQEWVRSMYLETKKLDPTRLVEDNSPCNNDHVQTDLNSWHSYLPGYLWPEQIAKFDRETYPGSTFNYIGGNTQGREPMLNSECGNVWGYTGSTGDVDYTWDYHLMMNAFRMHPKVCGWLYTEHHDVINEWNGYVRYDRSPKIDGLNELVPGMSLRDFHSPYYISVPGPLCTEAQAGSRVEVPLYASFMTDRDPGALTLSARLVGWNSWGEYREWTPLTIEVPFEAYLSRTLEPLELDLPEEQGLFILQIVLQNTAGETLHRNFTTFRIKEGREAAREKVIAVSFAPDSYRDQQWSIGQTEVLDGLKVNGFGSGYFEYEIPWPQECRIDELRSVGLRFEASSKELFGKDRESIESIANPDFMRGGGTHDPCKNPNSYAMTDTRRHESWVKVSVNGVPAGLYRLPDDPADHRGILSWHAQLQDRLLREAGSYGYLIDAPLPLKALREGEPIVIRLEVPREIGHGLAIYGKDFGRYPVDPLLMMEKK